jgi:predicted NACHT family NTPase
VAFSHDGRKVLTGSWDKTARLWDAETGAQLQTFKRHTDHDLCASTDVECGLVDSVAISPDGRWALTGSFDKTARLWDTQTGAELRHFDIPSEAVNVDVTSVAFSQDAHMVLTGSSDRSVLLWDAETGKELQHYDGCSAWVNSVAFSPDGRKVLAGGDDGTARLWDRETGKELKVFTGHSDRVTSVAFWGEHKVLTASWDGTTKL